MCFRPWTVLFLLLAGSAQAAAPPTAPSPLGNLTKPKASKKPKQLKESARMTFKSWVTSLAFSPDDKTLAVGLKDSVQLMDLRDRSVHKEFTGKWGQVRALAYSSDGSQLLIGGYQKAALWDPQSGDLKQELKGHRGYVTSAAFSPDGKQIATGCEDEATRLWNAEDGSLILVQKGIGLPVNGVAWSADGQQVAAAIGDDMRPTRTGRILFFSAKDGAVQQDFEFHSKSATGIALTTDGKYAASSGIDEHVNIYDLAASKPLGFFGGHSRPVNAVVLHPDQETAISVSGGRAVGKNELKIFEYMTGEELASADEAHEAKIGALALSHDGRTVATGGQDQTAALWNVGFLAIGVPATAEAKPVSEAAESPPADALTVLSQAVPAADQPTGDAPKSLRAGIIGLDTSHAIAFTKSLNAEKPVAAVAGCRLVAAYPKGSPDIASSVSRVPGYTEEMKKLNVEIVDSIDDLLTKVDVVFLETNDGRPHLEQLLPVLKAGKPCFIDKPIAASLTDAVAIFEASRKYKVPVFSSSSLRFGKNTQAVRNGSLGKVSRCQTSSPASLEMTHPDLFWYGIHGVESLFTVMGTGCVAVTRSKTGEGLIEVTGEWSGDRVGVFREGKGYSGTATGETGTAAVGSYDGYDPLLIEIVKFFRTGQPPVTEQETLEIYAFMEAADESKRQDGARVTLESVLQKAREKVGRKLAE